jgi:hypothetical protein
MNKYKNIDNNLDNNININFYYILFYFILITDSNINNYQEHLAKMKLMARESKIIEENMKEFADMVENIKKEKIQNDKI